LRSHGPTDVHTPDSLGDLQSYADPCNTHIITRNEQISHPSLLKWIYCNRAGTGANAVDELPPRLSQNTCKVAKFPDNLTQARTHHFRLLISRFQVRVLGGSLEEQLVLQVKCGSTKCPQHSSGGF
jgi:hypothetical protein